MPNIKGNALLSGDSKTVDLMAAVPAQSEAYLKTLIAFANSDGGELVFGVEKDTHKIVGLKNKTLFDAMDANSSAMAENCEPRLNPSLWLKTIGDKTILIVSVLRGSQKPYYLKSQGLIDGTYQRFGGNTRLVENYQLKELILEGSRRYYDQQPCPDLEVTAEDIETLCESLYLRALKNTPDEREQKTLRRPAKDTLLSWGVLKDVNGQIVPTVAYALLTGQLPDQPCVQCAVFEGNTRARFLDRRDVTGPVQDQLDGAVRYVTEKLHRAMNDEARCELPVDSVRELIANTIASRSYLNLGNIQIALYDNRLEITAPGLLPSGITPQKLKEGYSKIRNRALAEAFAYMRLITLCHSGIPRCFKACEALGLPSPQLIDFDATLRIHVFRNKRQLNPPLQNRLQCRPVFKQNCQRAF